MGHRLSRAPRQATAELGSELPASWLQGLVWSRQGGSVTGETQKHPGPRGSVPRGLSLQVEAQRVPGTLQRAVNVSAEQRGLGVDDAAGRSLVLPAAGELGVPTLRLPPWRRKLLLSSEAEAGEGGGACRGAQLPPGPGRKPTRSDFSGPERPDGRGLPKRSRAPNSRRLIQGSSGLSLCLMAPGTMDATRDLGPSALAFPPLFPASSPRLSLLPPSVPPFSLPSSHTPGTDKTL